MKKDIPVADLKEALAVLEAERRDYGYINKLRKEAPEALGKLVARLKQKEETATQNTLSLPDSGIGLVVGKARIKGAVEALRNIRRELERAEETFSKLGTQISEINKEIKGRTSIKPSNSAIVPKKK
jgi:hypothetical protein